MPVGDHLVLSADCEYEGTTGMFRYYLGCMIRQGEYINVNFHADDEFNWTVGLGLGYSRFRVAAVYTRDRKFGIGLMVTENQP